MHKTTLAACLALGVAQIAGAADLERGRDLAKQCAACHGIDGLARMPMVPNIAGHDELYIVKQLEAFRAGERQNRMMAVVAGGLSDADIEALARWYSAIEVQVTLPQ